MYWNRSFICQLHLINIRKHLFRLIFPSQLTNDMHACPQTRSIYWFQQQFTFWKIKGTIFNIVSFLCYICLLALYNVYVHCSLLSSGECSIDKCPEETFFKLNRSNYLFLFLKLWSVFSLSMAADSFIICTKPKRVGSAFWHLYLFPRKKRWINTQFFR